jgi:hypothetical protein
LQRALDLFGTGNFKFMDSILPKIKVDPSTKLEKVNLTTELRDKQLRLVLSKDPDDPRFSGRNTQALQRAIDQANGISR